MCRNFYLPLTELIAAYSTFRTLRDSALDFFIPDLENIFSEGFIFRT
jgi:hypothetical protein